MWILSCGVLIPACWSRPDARDISKGVDWLTRYGYLPAPDPLTAQQQTLEGLVAAIKSMQRFAGLKETGKLDEDTIKMMQKPRCSLPDIIGTSEIMRRRRKRYALSGTVWSKSLLTWRVNSFPRHASFLTNQEIHDLMLKALNVWSRSSEIYFQETSTDADILIDFSRSHHEDGYPFDGPGGTLAHAFFPGEHPISGDTHFDDDEIWTKSLPEAYGTDLFAVAVHEFGHALGLAHSSAEESIMRPYYQGPVGNPDQYKLPQDDMSAIEQLYGRRKIIPGREKPVLPVPTQSKIPYSTPQGPTYNRPPDQPDRCKAHFDAIANIRGEVFFFKKRYFWRLQPSRNLVSLNPAQIHRFWEGLPRDLDRVDAAYERTNDSKIVFFRGNDYWVFKDTKAEPGYPRPLSDFGLPPDGIDAAFVWRHNGKTYFFQGSRFWRFDEHTSRMDLGYPKEVNMWQGVPQNVDDIVSWNDGNTYFFKGTKYWKFTGGKVESDIGFPRSVAHDWMYCDMTTEALPTQRSKFKDKSDCICAKHNSAVALPNVSFLYVFTFAVCWIMLFPILC
uniref:Matrix metalloproteinase-25 n=1 Tax=Geotrypetes seraphini TaxID=260995 RepID=A0A6P8QY84_GEOSA|nr:matrix metalloproteinase-25 [Geotrypetes seraphini]